MSNFESRQELRKKQKEDLEKIPEGQQISLDPLVLDELLFERAIITTEYEVDVEVKIPVWTGDFLRKIDLSRVSFSDVCWAPNEYLSSEQMKGWESLISDINFSYTNANIDLSRAFCRHSNSLLGAPEVIVCGCNFEGLDLSQNDLSGIEISLYYSNLSRTKLNLRSAHNAKKYDGISILNCNLEGLDLSWYTVNVRHFVDDSRLFLLGDSNFANTGLKIIGNYKDVSGQVALAMKEGRLFGCYYNGRLITSPDDKLRYSVTYALLETAHRLLNGRRGRLR